MLCRASRSVSTTDFVQVRTEKSVTSRLPTLRTYHEQCERSSRRALGERGLEAARREGKRLCLEAGLVDEDWNPVTGPDQVGEIVIRGHNIMKDCYKRPEATAEVIKLFRDVPYTGPRVPLSRRIGCLKTDEERLGRAGVPIC
ncbi:MAG: hypothetical protein EOP24_45195 [Hyphomicrobiales bacterium]|nr:MAG: hypothetical protein EOP24_45195 [Hyphomicrobiales bacterium]